ncbi:MAG: Helix-turn-helix domain [Neobacillus sp.]|jgi:hypothetical protein|nr:Helix-turn-helix domain [Neobacillus sp.]
MEQAYYTLKQAREILCVSEATIRRRIKSGEIPRASFSGRILIPAWFMNLGFEKESLYSPMKGESY